MKRHRALCFSSSHATTTFWWKKSQQICREWVLFVEKKRHKCQAQKRLFTLTFPRFVAIEANFRRCVSRHWWDLIFYQEEEEKCEALLVKPCDTSFLSLKKSNKLSRKKLPGLSQIAEVLTKATETTWRQSRYIVPLLSSAELLQKKRELKKTFQSSSFCWWTHTRELVKDALMKKLSHQKTTLECRLYFSAIQFFPHKRGRRELRKK